MFLFSACSMNDKGQITGLGVIASGEFHTYFITPTNR
jgi:hypothetical protein